MTLRPYTYQKPHRRGSQTNQQNSEMLTPPSANLCSFQDGVQHVYHDPVSAYLASLAPYTTSGIGGGSNGSGTGISAHLNNVKQRLRKPRPTPTSRFSHQNGTQNVAFVTPPFSPTGHVALPDFSGLPRSNTTESSCALSVIANGAYKAPVSHPHHRMEGSIGEWGNGYRYLDQPSRTMPSLLSSDPNIQHLEPPSPLPYPIQPLPDPPRLDRQSKTVEHELRQDLRQDFRQDLRHQSQGVIGNLRPQEHLLWDPRSPHKMYEIPSGLRTAVPSLTDAYVARAARDAVSESKYFQPSNPSKISTNDDIDQ